eukprot:Skav222081  [mRNA]  locus=scaffold2165:4585:5484:- [translate_table: standard]
MLVLFDWTYSSRLWTIFELAAFLKSHDVTHALIIRPTFLGPASALLFMFLTLVMVCIVFASFQEMQETFLVLTFVQYAIFSIGGHYLRRYLLQIDECYQQLRDFHLHKVSSHCCSVNHLDESGCELLCDREIIGKCIRSWFGSEEEFESTVRNQVSSAFMKGLGYYAFPFSWFIGASLPILWTYVDLMVARLRAGEFFFTLVGLLYALIMWLAAGPFGYFLCLWCAYKLRKRRDNKYWDVLVTLMGSGIMMMVSLCVYVLLPVLLLLGPLPGMLLWGFVMTISALVWWRLWLRAAKMKI